VAVGSVHRPLEERHGLIIPTRRLECGEPGCQSARDAMSDNSQMSESEALEFVLRATIAVCEKRATTSNSGTATRSAERVSSV